MSKLKVASSGAISDVFAERDIMKEASPHIVELFRAFQDTENLYFELELCEVGSLLDVYGTLSEGSISIIFFRILRRGDILYFFEIYLCRGKLL